MSVDSVHVENSVEYLALKDRQKYIPRRPEL